MSQLFAVTFLTGLQMTAAAIIIACVYALCGVHPDAVVTVVGNVLLNGGPILMFGSAVAWCVSWCVTRLAAQ